MNNVHRKTIDRLWSLIEERKPKEYSEMNGDIADVMYLTESERIEFYEAKQAFWANDSEAAHDRITARIAKRNNSSKEYIK